MARRLDERPKRIVRDQCCGVIIDVQDYFLAQVGKRLRSKLRTETPANLVRLLGHFRITIVATLEQPVDQKGPLPLEIGQHLGDLAQTFEKDFFDLCKDKPIRDYLAGLKKRQMIVAGGETDVSRPAVVPRPAEPRLRGLRGGGGAFSSSRDVGAAIARMKAEGAVFVTYKILCYELVEAVNTSRHEHQFGPFPDDLPIGGLEHDPEKACPGLGARPDSSGIGLFDE